MQLGQFTVDIDKSLAEIKLAHDVSGEKRDSSGKWTSGGQSEGKVKRFLRKRNEKKIAKEEAYKKLPVHKKVASGAARLGGAYAAQVVVLGKLAQKSSMPNAKKVFSNKRILQVAGKAGAVGAVGGTIGATAKHHYDKASEKTKKKIKVGLAVGGVTVAGGTIAKEVIVGKQHNQHLKVADRMKKNALKFPPGPDRRDALRRAEKFLHSPHDHREAIMKAARKYHGVSTIGEKIVKAIKRFKPLKVVKTVGLLLDCATSSGSTFEMASVVSSKPIKKTIKKFRKHKHKIPQLMTGF